MLTKVAKSVLTNAVRKTELTSVRTNYPYTRSLVIKRKSADAMSSTEKIFWTGIATVVILSFPAYIMLNLESYKGKAK